MTAETDQEMFRYLAEVSKMAEGRMSATARNQLVARTRSRIESQITARKATRASEVRQILLGVGTPLALVMAEANKDPLYAARERQRQRSGSTYSYGAASVFSPEVDPTVARLVTPETLTNPPPSGFGAEPTGGPMPEVPVEPDPFGAGQGEWVYGNEEGSEVSEHSGAAVPSDGGPQIPAESGNSFIPVSPPAPAAVAPPPPSVQVLARKTARGHALALFAVGALFLGAVVNAVAMSPYTIAIILVGYLLAMSSDSYTPGEKRFAMIGVPIAAILFYAFGLFLARGRSTGHNGPLNSSDTWQAAKDGFTAVPTMLGLLGALYLLWRLFKSVAKAG